MDDDDDNTVFCVKLAGRSYLIKPYRQYRKNSSVIKLHLEDDQNLGSIFFFHFLIELQRLIDVLLQNEQRGPAYMTSGQFAPQALGRRDRPEAVQNARNQAYDMRMQHNKVPQVLYMASLCSSGSLENDSRQVPGLKTNQTL